MKRCIMSENSKLSVAKLVNIPDIACMDAGKGREQDAEAFTAFRALILKLSDIIHSPQN